MMYRVTTDKARFRTVFDQVFAGRQVLTVMSVLVHYNEARKKTTTDSYMMINYDELCEAAAADNVTPEEIKDFLTKLAN